MGRSCGPEALAAAEIVLDWARAQGLRDWWGTGIRDGSFIPVLDHGGKSYSILSMWTNGRIEVLFQYFVNWAPFDDEEKRLELAARLSHVPGVEIPLDAITRRPTILLDRLHGSDGSHDLLEVFEWVLAEFRAT